MNMHLVRWEPFREAVGLRQTMSRLFEDSMVYPTRFWPENGGGGFKIDMYQTEDSVVVKASLPGIKPEEVDISVTGDMVTIRGEHKEEPEIKEEAYLRKEQRYGSFCRAITIPVDVKSDKAEAVFENGILTLTLPKAEEVKTRSIKVKVKKAIESKK